MAEMKSEETDLQEEISEENQMYYDKKMQNFECPFTWEMDEAKYTKTEYNPHDDEEFIPLMKLMRCIMRVYIDVENKDDSKTILDKISECDNIIDEMKESAHQEISMEAVIFVLRSTKSFVFLRLKMETELKQSLAEIKSINSSEKYQTSTIKACKSIAWSNYRLCGTTEAIKFIREAISDNPKCDLWHFVLGKMLRRKRRGEKFNDKPNFEETECFKKAYNMMKNPVYGVFLAQVYREQRNKHMSLTMYDTVLRDVPQSDTLLLRMALGFMTLGNFEKAKFCLDKVAKNSGGTSMYLHYRGLYHFKQQQYREASLFLKEAIEDKNLAAEYNYMIAMQKIDKHFDVTQHLLQMLDKYGDRPKDALQQILLQLAFTYFKKNRNLKESLKYFLDAIEINSEAKSLKDFSCYCLCNNREKKIYVILSQEVLPIVLRQPKRFDKMTYERAEKLKEYCDKHTDAEFERVNNAFSRFRF